MLDSMTQQQARELERQYLRQWRAKNRDKMKAYRERYWAKKARQLQEEQEEGDNQHAQNENRES